MDTFTAVDQHLEVLRGLLGTVSRADAASRVASLGDDDVVAVLRRTTSAIRELEAVRVVATGVAADRSARGAGHDGLAQRKGHRTPVSLVQQVTGASRGDAVKSVRLGQSLTSGTFAEGRDAPGTDAEGTDAVQPDGADGLAWDAALADAFLAGRISLHQQTAIRTGLGEPPMGAGDAWATAAERLIEEASLRTVEDLAASARCIRDLLDPEGAQRRFDERFDRRSFRLWMDADGVRHGSFVFDDDGGAWVTAIIDSALRPRRGGPRFVDPEEVATAEALAADPRTNEQLTYDLVIDVLRAGASADAATVFGTRQAAIRVVVTDDALASGRAGRAAVAVIEDTVATVPATFAAQRACAVGTAEYAIDHAGNPLYLGRKARTFSPEQKVALSIRDGGCRWPGCDRPPAYCESHHIDPHSEGGKTDVDRGILLCRYHHVNLHHHGWRITRDGTGPFMLHPAVGAPIVLESRLERRYAWGDLQPPPIRFRGAA